MNRPAKPEHSSKSLSLSTLLICILSFYSPNLLAAESSTDIETIVVTASRTSLPLSNVGSSIDIRTGQDLADRQSVFLSEVLREIPGMAVSRQGVRGSSTQLRVRGAEGNHVMVLIDGIEVNDLSQGSEFNFAHLGTHEIERVEVVRGPQSALWGSDALSGVINIISSTATTPFSVNAAYEGGSFGTSNGSFSLSSRGDRYHVKFSTQYIDTEGENISRSGSEDDGYRNLTYNLLAGTDLTEQLQLDLVYREVDATNEYDGIDFFVTGLPEDQDLETESEHKYGRVSARLSLLDDRWEQLLSYGITDTDNANLDVGSLSSSTRGERTRWNYQSNLYVSTAAIDHVFTLAYDHEAEEYRQRGTSFGIGFDPNKNLDTTTRSWILEYRADLWQKLQMSASGRADDNDEFDDSTSYRFTVYYALNNDTSRLHGAWGSGSKNPTFTERFGFFDSFIGNPHLQPEESVGWELGLEQKFPAQHILVDLTWFDEELEDEINGFVFDPATLGFTSENTSGTSHREGVELTFDYAVNGNVNVRAAYTYLNADELDSLTGEKLQEVRRPENTASVNLNYRFLDNKANLNVSVSYNGSQIDNFFPPFPASPQRVTLDSFTLVNMAARYRFSERLTLFARIENLLDEGYEEVYGFSSPGMGAYAGLKYMYN
jgi:vitamin B12 transporter